MRRRDKISLVRFEHKDAPLAGPARFARRLLRNLLVASAIVGLSLLLGMAGYRFFEDMSWLEAFLNASMLLSGMGPVDSLQTDAGKLFAGIYALFCGLVIVIVTGLVLAPLLHRVLHALHVDEDDD